MDNFSLFKSSELAEASYADFNDLAGDYSDGSVVRLLTDAGGGGKFSETQAADFVKKWEVITHSPNTFYGYSATLFKSKEIGASEKYDYAIRGTEATLSAPSDLLTDVGDLVMDGLAVSQIVDMYNDWKFLTTESGTSYEAASLSLQIVETEFLAAARVVGDAAVLAYELELSARNDIIIDMPLGLVYKIELVPSLGNIEGRRATGSGILYGKDIELDVTGHSLGGHLAAAFTRLFPDTGAEATTINGAGFATGLLKGLSGNAATNIRNLFSSLGGASNFNPDRIHNLYGSAGPELVTMDDYHGLEQQGSHSEVFIESWGAFTNTFGHGKEQMTNALAIMDLFVRLDVSLAAGSTAALMARLNPIFEAASTNKLASFEAVIDALGRIILPGYSPLNGVTEDREELFSRIHDIRTAIDDKHASVNSLVALNPSDIADLAGASGGEAYRIALLELSPFALVGLDYSSRTDMALYDPLTGTGQITQQWLTDRAELLHWKLELGLIDRVTSADDPSSISNGRSLWLEDRTSEQTLYLGSLSEAPHIVFGRDDYDDILLTGALGGRLYGGGGNDQLTGLSGDDYLEGGADNDALTGRAGADTLIGMDGNDAFNGGTGNDLLEGGRGEDFYQFTSGDGFDRVFDVDGNNHILINGIAAPVGKQVGPNTNVWVSEDNSVRFTLGDKDKGKQSLLISYGNGDRILIENYKAGAFGLTLSDYQAPVVVVPSGLTPKRGDLKPIDVDPLKPEVQLGYDSLGNVLVDPETPEAGRDDALYGSTGNDELLGLGGKDRLNGGSGNDKLDGGTDDDQLHAGIGNDTLIGGLGSDRLFAAQGNDQPLRTFATRSHLHHYRHAVG